MIIKYIIIRDDDVNKLSSKFLKFFQIANNLDIKINYAVIPYKLSKKTINFLNKQSKHKLNICVHGYKHLNYSKNINKYEFGDNRSLKQQIQDIKKGTKIIKKNFKKEIINNVFVPPFHGMNLNTLKALGKCNYKYISTRNNEFIKNNKITNIGIDINCNIYNKTQVKMITKKEIISKINNSKKKLISLNIHHETLSEQKLNEFFKVMNYYKKKKIKFLLYSELTK